MDSDDEGSCVDPIPAGAGAANKDTIPAAAATADGEQSKSNVATGGDSKPESTKKSKKKKKKGKRKDQSPEKKTSESPVEPKTVASKDEVDQNDPKDPDADVEEPAELNQGRQPPVAEPDVPVADVASAADVTPAADVVPATDIAPVADVVLVGDIEKEDNPEPAGFSSPITEDPVEAGDPALTDDTGASMDTDQILGDNSEDTENMLEINDLPVMTSSMLQDSQNTLNLSSIPGAQDISLLSTDSSLEGLMIPESNTALYDPGNYFRVIQDNNMPYQSLEESLHSDEESITPQPPAQPEDITTPRSVIGDEIEQKGISQNDQLHTITSEDTDDIIDDVMEHYFSHSSSDSLIKANPQTGGEKPTTTTKAGGNQPKLTVTEFNISLPSRKEQDLSLNPDFNENSFATDDTLALSTSTSILLDDVISPLTTPRDQAAVPTKNKQTVPSFSYKGTPYTPSKLHEAVSFDKREFYDDDFDDILYEQPGFVDQEPFVFDAFSSDWRRETDLNKPVEALKLKHSDSSGNDQPIPNPGLDKSKAIFTDDLPRRIHIEGLTDDMDKDDFENPSKRTSHQDQKVDYHDEQRTQSDKRGPQFYDTQHSNDPDTQETNDDAGYYTEATSPLLVSLGEEKISSKSARRRDLDDIFRDIEDYSFKDRNGFNDDLNVDTYADLLPTEHLATEYKTASSRKTSPFRRVEDTVLRDSDDLQLKGPSEDAPSKTVPAKIREIITENLAVDAENTRPASMSAQNVETMQEENQMLMRELNRVEDLLAGTRAERDEIGIKYNAISERLESVLKASGGDSGAGDDGSSKSLIQQNSELRRRLDEDHSSYKRKLQAYQDGQQRQAQLVQKLQAKVLQYKRKCGELEETVRSVNTDAERSRRLTTTQESLQSRLETTEHKLRLAEADHNMDLETALIKLEEEQQRSASLAHVNAMLREQLDQATSANQALTADIHKLTQDWQRAREELEVKESEWRQEEQSFNEYFSAEHSRLLALWRAVVAFRRQFSEMKAANERDMGHIRADFSRASRSMHSACLNLSANQRNVETQSQVDLDREARERLTVEHQLKQKVQDIIDLQAKFDAHGAEMNARLNELTVTNERLKMELIDKDRNISSLQRSNATLEVKLGHSDEVERPPQDLGNQERDEIDAMHEALRRIAQEVIHDADQSLVDDNGDPELSTSVIRPSSPLRSASRSPVRGRVRSRSPRRSPTRARSPGFADSTYSAVQAALNKRQLQVSELRAKLTAARDQNSGIRRSLDDVQNEGRRLEQQLLSIKEDRDNAMRGQQDSERNQDRLRHSLEVMGAEKTQLERIRQALSEQIECASAENNKLQACNADLQNQRDQLEDEKDDVNKDKDRQYKENERCHRMIEQCENKLSKLKEDLVNTKEALNRALLEKEVLDQEKSELSEAYSKAELCKAELELEINKVKTEEASLRDALLKMQALNEGLGQDKIELNKIIMQLEAQNNALCGDNKQVEMEKTGLREELVRVEQEKLDVENEKQGLNHSLALNEKSRERLEEEIMLLNREKGEVTEQLNSVNRHKAALAEELLNARKEIERQSDTIVRIAKEKEELTRDKAELTVQVTATERENRQQSEIIASVKSDKDALETQLYETQQVNASLDSRKEQLEGENQELILKKENLIAEVQRTRKEMQIEVEKLERQKENLGQKLAQTEKDLQLALKQEQQAHEEDLDRLTKEKDRQRMEMESHREDIIHRFTMEKEDLVSRYEKEKEDMSEDFVSLQRERDEQLIMAENDKQQALSLIEQEKCTVQEKLANCVQDLNASNVEYERLKRDSLSRQEQDRGSINGLQAEIKNIKGQFDDTCRVHEKDVKDLTNQIRDLQSQKEGALREVAELKVQLKMVEETRDTIRRDLIEANRRIREGDECRELMRKENTDLKRNINEEIHEKEAVAMTAHDLRNMVKKAEGEKTELNRGLQDSKQRIGVLEEQKAGVQKEASDLRASLREVEKARLEARRELQELRRQVKCLDGERVKLTQEVTDLQTRVARDEEKEEEARREIFALKQKLVETEASREALRKELANLQRKFAEFEDETRLREKDFQMALDDSRRSERKLDDQRHNLEVSLDNCNAELAETKLRLSASEGRVTALEGELARVEGAKRDVEFKISSIVSSLRRTIGFRAELPRSRSPMRARSISPRRSRPNSPTKGFENTYTTTTEGRGSPIPRTGSPDRARSPFRDRSMSPSRLEAPISIADIDPEAVRTALRDFVQQLANSERERDDSFSQLRSITGQLKEMEEDRDRIEARLQQLQRSLGEAEEGKRDIDGRLASAQTALMLQEETIRRNERERKQMAEKINESERHLAAADSERRQQEERMQKLRLSEEKLEEDKKNLRVGLDDAENRVTKGELARRALEGDLQRMKLALNDKETENQVLGDRVEALNRNIQDTDTKCQSLQLTIDRLSGALAKSEEEEHSQKDKVQSLNMTLSDSSATIQELQERATQLQRSLTGSEHDRRVLQEKLDTTRQALNEAKKQNHNLMERVQVMQNELSDSEVRRAELEGQIRQSHTLIIQRQETEQELQQRLSKLQTEKQSLAERIASLQRTLANAENEKREIERSTVRMEKDKTALKKTLDKVEREKLRHEEILTKSMSERTNIDRAVGRLEEDNIEMQRQIQTLQAQLAVSEQDHSQRLIDLTTRHRQETEHETERLRSAQLQGERLLEARERAHRQRVKGLEEQVTTLKDQLGQEMRKRQQYISRSARAGDEIKDLRSALDGSLGNIARDPSLDPLLLEYETKKLDDAIDLHGPKLGSSRLRKHSPTRSTSPMRLGRGPLARPTPPSIRRSITSSPAPVRSSRLS